MPRYLPLGFAVLLASTLAALTLAKKVRGLNADVVVLTGDAIDSADALPLLQSFVQALKPSPVLLVPGNWAH